MSTRKRSTEKHRGYSRVYGTDVFVPLLSQCTRQVYSSQLDVA